VKRGTASGKEKPIAPNLSEVSYSDTGLDEGTMYFYVVEAVNDGQVIVSSQEESATPEDTV
jgi:hypothetical protein